MVEVLGLGAIRGPGQAGITVDFAEFQSEDELSLDTVHSEVGLDALYGLLSALSSVGWLRHSFSPIARGRSPEGPRPGVYHGFHYSGGTKSS